MSDEFLHNKLTLEEVLKKNENSSAIISELTAVSSVNHNAAKWKGLGGGGGQIHIKARSKM